MIKQIKMIKQITMIKRLVNVSGQSDNCLNNYNNNWENVEIDK